MAREEIHSFLRKFLDLWKTGLDASLNLETHAGEASVVLRLGLGPFTADKGREHPELHRKKVSPSQIRRRRRRAQARREAANLKETSAEDVDSSLVIAADASATEIEVSGEEDSTKNIEEIIRSYKNGEDEFYKCEEIITETEDGFLLTVHRLPNDGPPVLLQHGLLECVLTPRLSIDRKI